MRRKASKQLTTSEEFRKDDKDLLELDWYAGVQLIPRLPDQDYDHPRMRKIHKPSDAIQATMRTDARLRSTPFPGESDGR